MRNSLIDYARTVQPLQERLDGALSQGKRTRRAAAAISLSLTSHELDAFESVKKLLADSATLALPKDDATMCLFTDASLSGWSIIVTQVPEWQHGTPAEQTTS